MTSTPDRYWSIGRLIQCGLQYMEVVQVRGNAVEVKEVGSRSYHGRTERVGTDLFATKDEAIQVARARLGKELRIARKRVEDIEKLLTEFDYAASISGIVPHRD